MADDSNRSTIRGTTLIDILLQVLDNQTEEKLAPTALMGILGLLNLLGILNLLQGASSAGGPPKGPGPRGDEKRGLDTKALTDVLANLAGVQGNQNLNPAALMSLLSALSSQADQKATQADPRPGEARQKETPPGDPAHGKGKKE